MQKILIVVDMQNDFVTGSLGSEAAQVAAKNIAAHINEYDTVIFTRDTHGPDYLDTLEGKFLPVPHCIKDTEGWEIIPELVNGVSKVKNLYVVDKNTFGTFIWGSMSVNMSVDEDATIEICGVCTDICVVSNALIMRAFRPNQRIESQKGCCRVALDGQSYEDELTWADHLGEDNLLQPVFRDGNMIKEDTLHDIRARLYKEGF